MKKVLVIMLSAGSFGLVWVSGARAADEFPKPYSPPCVERENVFEFTEKPKVKDLGNDKYEITFAVKANCDVTVGLIDDKGTVVRHLGAGVLGANAPAPFQKNSLKQTIYWNGKDDLDWYVKEPGRSRVRVMLGLKPEFDKRLGGTSAKNLPGATWGLAADPEGVYVFSIGRRGRTFIRKFSHDGDYLASLVPPPPTLPEDKLTGMGYVEYEAGKKTPHARGLYMTSGDHGHYLSRGGKSPFLCQPAAAGGRLFYANSAVPDGSMLYHVFNDGATSRLGCAGRPLAVGLNSHMEPQLAASPDGKWIYFADDGGHDARVSCCAVWRCPADGAEPAKPFLGVLRQPGSDDKHLNGPRGLACDAQGRIYVCDVMNNRLQIFSPDGKVVKTLPADRPQIVAVHQKTGAVYLHHAARVQGKTCARLTKFAPFDNLNEEFHVDDLGGDLLALDSWSAKPRLWLAQRSDRNYGVRVYEDDGKTLRKVDDFNEAAEKEAGENFFGFWSGMITQKTVCDPVRERVLYNNGWLYDLRTGKLLMEVRVSPGVDDFAFDKRGYLHCHFTPSSEGFKGVGRADPALPEPYRGWVGERKVKVPIVALPEVPYDYGEESGLDRRWKGLLPVKDQGGPHGFQMGVGVNMCGDIVVQSCIYYVPKREDETMKMSTAGVRVNLFVPDAMDSHAEEKFSLMLRGIKDMEKLGEHAYFIHQGPGVPLSGGMAWTFDRNGELRRECAVNAGATINGVQIDEDGEVYFVTRLPKMHGEKAFLFPGGGNFGESEKLNAMNGTLIKTKGGKCRVLMADAPVPQEPPPSRPPDLAVIGFSNLLPGKGSWCWAEDVAWLYAGASPIVQGAACQCPQMRHHTDWYKRTFVPEAYRHSIGVVDTNGNLIMHIGRYGNFDSGDGPKSRIRVGGDEVGMAFAAIVSGTDNYLCFDDHGERLVVLKLNYHAEETAGIGNQ